MYNIPTCGYVQLNARTDFQWAQVADISFKLSHFLKPKELM
ncbi:MAG: hypothetical protein ACI9RV_000181 [Glaciecola sp.]